MAFFFSGSKCKYFRSKKIFKLSNFEFSLKHSGWSKIIMLVPCLPTNNLAGKLKPNFHKYANDFLPSRSFGNYSEVSESITLFVVVVVVKSLSPIWFFATSWTVAHQGPLTMGFPRWEYWNGLPFHSPGDLPYLGIEPMSPALQVDSLPMSHQGSPETLDTGPQRPEMYIKRAISVSPESWTLPYKVLHSLTWYICSI